MVQPGEISRARDEKEHSQYGEEKEKDLDRMLHERKVNKLLQGGKGDAAVNNGHCDWQEEHQHQLMRNDFV